MAENLNYFYTIGGYIALIGLGYAIYQVSTQNQRKKIVAAQGKASKSAQPEPRKEDRKKKQRMESFTSENNDPATKALRAKAVKAPESSTWTNNTNEKDSRDDEVDNREFARQLAKAKEGTKFAAKSDSGKQREKSVKQSRANQIDGLAPEKAEKASAPSSTGGVDADDDQSPITSPDVAPADGPTQAGDVSDMLEAAPAGPSVLRLTDTEPKKQKQKAAKAPQQVETKKQRQNRKKAEAAKVAREEAEKERKVLEEKQRRQARIAEGRAAKDGSQFIAANGNKSAWTQGATNGDKAETNGLHQPLDTFEKPQPATAAAPKPKPAPAPKPSADSNWVSSLPSEEEQIEMLKGDDDWSTVPTKSSKRASKKEAVDSGDERVESRPAAQPKQPVAGASQSSKPSKSFGSFSALSTNDEAGDEEEQEEEWDV